MKLSEVIDAIKSFFLDFLGFFLPGIYAILLLSYAISPRWQFDLKALHFINDKENLVLLLFAYIIGYVIFSVDLSPRLTTVLFSKKIKPIPKILEEIKNSPDYSYVLNAIKRLWVDKQGHPILDQAELDKFTVLNLRSLSMSYCPESDTKVYTFMFRSELCRTVGEFSFLCGLAGLLSSGIHLFCHDWTLFNTSSNSTIAYAILILGGRGLIILRYRFLKIAYEIPFSIFLAKYYKLPA